MTIFPFTISRSFSYDEYRAVIQALHKKQKTTGANAPDSYLTFSLLNEKRMDRLEKKGEIIEPLKQAIQSIKAQYTFLVLTESWCGDAAQSLPIINKMVELSEHLKMKLILRDEHPEIMNKFLTNGGKSIPKLICLDESGNVCFTWGPRPEPLQSMVAAYYELPEPKKSYGDFSIDVQQWYNKDKTQTLQREFCVLLKQLL